jgi:hypothetical protein
MFVYDFHHTQTKCTMRTHAHLCTHTSQRQCGTRTMHWHHIGCRWRWGRGCGGKNAIVDSRCGRWGPHPRREALGRWAGGPPSRPDPTVLPPGPRAAMRHDVRCGARNRRHGGGSTTAHKVHCGSYCGFNERVCMGVLVHLSAPPLFCCQHQSYWQQMMRRWRNSVPAGVGFRVRCVCFCGCGRRERGRHEGKRVRTNGHCIHAPVPQGIPRQVCIGCEPRRAVCARSLAKGRCSQRRRQRQI